MSTNNHQLLDAPEAHQLVVVAPKSVMHITQEQAEGERHAREHQPSVQAYSEVIFAYEHFNEDLIFQVFGRRLPRCLLTFQRRSMRTKGYFHGDRFGHAHRAGQTTDEIALNPRFFVNQDVKDTLGTLVHEMLHLYIHHFDPRRYRGAYHSRSWAEAMIAVGLHPTADGTMQGKQTGQRVSHIVLPGKPFDVSAGKLITNAFRISWYDRLHELLGTKTAGTAPPNGSLTVFSQPTSGQRAKFTCPSCQVSAWGKPSLKLVCGDCNAPMRA